MPAGISKEALTVQREAREAGIGFSKRIGRKITETELRLASAVFEESILNDQARYLPPVPEPAPEIVESKPRSRWNKAPKKGGAELGSEPGPGPSAGASSGDPNPPPPPPPPPPGDPIGLFDANRLVRAGGPCYYCWSPPAAQGVWVASWGWLKAAFGEKCVGQHYHSIGAAVNAAKIQDKDSALHIRRGDQ